MENIINKEIKAEASNDHPNAVIPHTLDLTIYNAIHKAIRSYPSELHSNKAPFNASKTSPSLFSRLSSRIINPFGYTDIIIE